MMKWLLGVAALPIGAAALIYGVGVLLPREHSAHAETILPVPAGRLAAVIRDVEAQPRWRRGVHEIEVIERRPDGLRYVERSGGDAITFDFAEEVAGARFRSTIADPALPFGGSWTISLAPHGEATRIRIEERGFVPHPVYRFFSALVFGHDKTMKAYLADLPRGLSG